MIENNEEEGNNINEQHQEEVVEIGEPLIEQEREGDLAEDLVEVNDNDENDGDFGDVGEERKEGE